MATTLESALASSFATFYGCSGKEGDKHQLNKGELKEMPIFMGEQPGEHRFWGMMKNLKGEDNMISFKEYMVLLGCLSVFCNDFGAKDHGAAGQC